MNPMRLLAPLVPAYATAAALKNLAYAHGWVRPRHLRAPVISVGNLSAGGAGKTPFVLCLAGLLGSHGYTVDVLSRGYGRSGAATERVDPASGDACRYGDEPLLLAQQTGVPVYVGASRHAAGLLAEQDSQTHFHLLDDGFQHRQLARRVDIVLLHPSDAAEWPLPAGRLREPFGALGRAHIAVLRAGDTETEAALRRRGLSIPVWRIMRELALPPALSAISNQGASRDPGSVAGDPPAALAFCGIAHPQEFFSELRQAGVSLAATCGFADHHAYTKRELDGIAGKARAVGASHLLTTEKDWVRLSPDARSILAQAAPVYPIPLLTRLADEQQALEQLIALAGLGPARA